MANSTFIQFRTSEEDKREATEILEQLGMNLSTLLNMTIKQVILKRGIPFDVVLPEEKKAIDPALQSVSSTMALEGMKLSSEDLELLSKYRAGELSEEQIKSALLKSAGVSYE